MSKSVTIFGATGAQGSPVVKEALAQGLTVRAVARDADKVARLHPDAHAVAATFDDVDALADALHGVDAAFAHLPTPVTPEDPARWLGNLITAAHRVSLPLMVYTTGGSSGARYASSVLIDGLTAQMHALQQSGIPTIVLQPTVYLENLQIDMMVPKLRSEGVLDYPPVRPEMKVTWTSHLDQAVIAVAALMRPDLAGNAYEIGTPGPLTGGELATYFSATMEKPVEFAPLSPQAFGERSAVAMENPALGFLITDLYEAIAKLTDDGMVIDTGRIEEIFNVKLTPVEQHIKNWAKSTLSA